MLPITNEFLAIFKKIQNQFPSNKSTKMAEMNEVKKQNDKSVNEQRSRLPVETQNEGGNKKKIKVWNRQGPVTSRDV